MKKKKKLNIPRAIMIVLAYLPALFFTILNIVYILSIKEESGVSANSTIESIAVIFFWILLAYFITSRFTKQNMIAVMMMMVWIVFLFYENSEKIPPSTSAIIFSVYFSLILIMNILLRRRDNLIT